MSTMTTRTRRTGLMSSNNTAWRAMRLGKEDLTYVNDYKVRPATPITTTITTTTTTTTKKDNNRTVNGTVNNHNPTTTKKDNDDDDAKRIQVLTSGRFRGL